MKKTFAILIILSLLVSITACASSPEVSAVQPALQTTSAQTTAPSVEASPTMQISNPSGEASISSPLQTETESTATPSDDGYDPNNFDDWNQAKAAEPKSDNPMAFCNLFPDPYFANIIARIFNKKVNDITTFDELASYTGELDCSSTLFGLENIKGIGYLTGITTFTCYKNA
jgi:hypothetical protein